MSSLLSIIVLLLFILTALLLLGGLLTLRRRQVLGGAITTLIGVVFLLLTLLTGFLAISVQGYHALNQERLIAVIETTPIRPQTFEATFYFPDRSTTSFILTGDEVYIDAHILKWKPLANLLGLQTLYELDRVAGRYTDLADERMKPRTIYSLAREKPFNLFDLRRRYPILEPIVDATYGSATFIMADRSKQFELRVSNTGLLIRSVEL